VDEGDRSAPVVAADDAAAGFGGYGGDFRERLACGGTESLQEMERRRLVERQAGNPIRPRERNMEGDSAAVGMSDKMDLARAPVDQIDGTLRLIGEGECVLAGPMAGAVAAVVLRGVHRVARAERGGELLPLTGAGT